MVKLNNINNLEIRFVKFFMSYQLNVRTCQKVFFFYKTQKMILHTH